MKEIVVALSIGLMLTGCAGTGAKQVVPEPKMQVKVEKPVTPAKKPFSERISVGAIRDVETNDGYRKVQVSVRNLTGEAIRTLYRFHWFDGKGIEVSAPNQDLWHSLVVIGGDEIVLSATAPEKNCPDVKLLIKEAFKK